MRAIAASAARARVGAFGRVCGRALCAYQSSREFGAVVLGALVTPFFARFSPPFLGGFFVCFGWGFGLPFWGCGVGVFLGVLVGGKWANVNGNGQPIKRTGARAHGNRKRRKRERAHGLPVLGGFSSVRQILSF